MVLVSDNHCLLMPSGLLAKTIERYMRNLLAHGQGKDARVPDKVDCFQLLSISNSETVKQLRHQGVKKINLNVGQYIETSRMAEESRPKGKIVEQLGLYMRDTISALVTKEADRQHIEEAENVNARLVITFDGRRPGLRAENLAPIAEAIANEGEEDIEIETSTGQRIKGGHLILRKAVNVSGFAKTVHHNDAWEKMEDYFNELTRSGVL